MVSTQRLVAVRHRSTLHYRFDSISGCSFDSQTVEADSSECHCAAPLLRGIAPVHNESGVYDFRG